MAEKNEDPGFFAIIPATVRYDMTIPDGAKLLYAEITSLAKRKGYCWTHNDYFAELYKTSERTISRWISALQEKNHIVVRFIYFPDSKKIKERHIYIQIKTAAASESETPVVTKMSVLDAPVVTKMSTPSGDKNGVDTSKDLTSKAAAADQSSPESERTQPKTAAAEVFDQNSQKPQKPPDVSPEEVQKLNLHFQHLDPKFLFDAGFYPKVLNFLSEHSLGLNYVSWFYELCVKNRPKNLTNYFFKTFLETRYVELFRETTKPPPIILVHCPVCGFEHDVKDSSCSRCGFSKDSITDPDQVYKNQKLYLMPAEIKKAYLTEFDSIIGQSLDNFKEKNIKLKNLDLKYGLSQGDSNIERDGFQKQSDYFKGVLCDHSYL